MAMKRLVYMAISLVAWAAMSVQAQQLMTWYPPAEEEVYEVQDLRSAGDFLLEQAVNCEHIILLRIQDNALSAEEREKLFYLLPVYRIAGLKVYPMSDNLYMLVPEHKSCVRMLHYARGHRNVLLTQKEREALDVAQKALRELGVDKMGAAEKARALHDWVVLHAAYDVENAHIGKTYEPEEYSPFDGKYLFLEGKGVCDSYVQAYWLLMQLSGVPCSMISGYVPKYKENHAWNLVYMNGRWSHVDTTFDDPVPDKPGQVVLTNFDKTDEQMRESRTWPRDMYVNADQNAAQYSLPRVFGSEMEFLDWLKQNPLPENTPARITVNSVQSTAEGIQRLQQAVTDAKLPPLTIHHDPFHPEAFVIRRAGAHRTDPGAL